GVDDDGFLVYAERSAPGRDLAADLALAGVRAALVLPDDARLAFRAGETLAGPDEYEREVDEATALAFLPDTRPPTEVLFPDVEPRPYMYWGPMQDTRVRYFRDEGPRRFTSPDEVEGGEDEGE
ncbi:MAG TPA: hypothetical protein RMI62_08810, partial [Polyangiaceae bacterium LLY-WYZ-15_(1-7)]|nr:hypothetical protein [Polyangiaceae bacterium LLY-WYZ-15_(1-7)]